MPSCSCCTDWTPTAHWSLAPQPRSQRISGRSFPIRLGHGASEKPAVTYRFATFADFNQELLESLGVKRAVVVGESLGEWIAADVVLRFPETFTKLAIADSAGVTLDSRVISPKDFREHYISSNYDLRKLEIGCAASRSCRANTVAGRD
jgi:pimeloyl-ACP methyl ester carboxylesterase